ncbi:MAG TPA: ActD-like protein [Polyangia bacterium]|nr:ActD-like protein [Polyangia bacterium]
MKSQSPNEESHWMLERLALGELDAATAAELRQRLKAAGVDVDEALARLAASNVELLAAHPPGRVVPAIRSRVAAEKRATARPRRAAFFAVPVLAGALALALWARPGQHRAEPGAAETLEPTTLKGPTPAATRLLVYRHESSGDRPLADGARAAEGDLVQLAYRERHGGFGLLLSIDGAGEVTLHWPEQSGNSAARLETAAEVRLPSAYQLDGAPGFERFFLVTAPRPFAVGPVVAAARALASRPGDARVAPLPLPPSYEQTSIALDKPGAARKELR